MGIIEMLFGNPWLLLIALWTGDTPEDTQFYMQVQMESEAACMQAAQDMVITFDIFQHLNPDLHLKVMCKEDTPIGTYQES